METMNITNWKKNCLELNFDIEVKMNEYIPNRYKILQKIGEGVHGVVLKAIDTTQDNKVVAIKKVSLRTKFGGFY
jgi:serine/threonine protein kinase